MISAIIAAILRVFGDLLGGLLTSPRTTGKVSSGTAPLEASSDSAVDARLRRAGLLLCLATVLGGCGVFERQKEVIVAVHYPVEDWPDGVPILAQDEVLVMLKDGTIAVLKHAGGMQIWHPSDTKNIIERGKK